MRHKVKGNHLGRPYNQAKALYRNLVFSLLDLGRVQTTRAKAKAVVGVVDKVINFAKKNDVSARRNVIKILGSDQKIDKLFSEVAPKLSGRNSGYTRIVQLGQRYSDTASMVYLELVNFSDNEPATPKELTATVKKEIPEKKVAPTKKITKPKQTKKTK